MSGSRKVFWGEGLFLRPQHFQQQDAYHEGHLRGIASALHPYAWGVRNAVFDQDALNNGTLRALELSLVFADGEIYSGPDQDELPDALSLEALPPQSQGMTIYAGLPLLKESGGNFSPDGTAAGAASTRFLQANQATIDLFTDAPEAEIAYLRKALRLFTDDQPKDQFISVPVARVRRTSTGGFELDTQFIPPCVSIQSSPALLLQLRRLLDALQAKVATLYGHHREPSKNIIEFRSGDIASFWLLHTANAAFAGLSHLFNHPALHPERLYQKLLELAGQLLTFSKNYSLEDLPAYRHADPGPGFAKLLGIVRELLDTVISTRYFQIALNEVKPSYHLGQLSSERIDAGTTFYLSAAADLPPAELVEVVPLRFKVGAPDDVEKLVMSAMPGVKLQHAPQVPAAIPVRPGSYYFSLEARGSLYEKMLQSQSVMIYVPAGLRELKLELIAVTA